MGESDVALLLLAVAVIVAVAKVAGRVARRCGQPPVLGEIVGGLLLGGVLVAGGAGELVLPTPVRSQLTALAQVGLVLFMFGVGLELDTTRLRRTGRLAGGVAVGAGVVPFVLGGAMAVHLLPRYGPHDRLAFVLFVAVVMSVTAFPVLARILVDRGMLRTRVGTLGMSAAALCDLAAWSLLAVVQLLVVGGARPWLVVLVLPLVGLLVLLRPWLARLLGSGGLGSEVDERRIGVVLVGVFACAAATQAIGLHFIFGAFLLGLVLPRSADHAVREALLRRVHGVTVLLLPIYFVVAGLQIDVSAVGTSQVAVLVLVLVVAVGSKFGGTILAGRLLGVPLREATVLATLMNTRGLTEIVVLGIGLEIGVIDDELYSLLVVMAVLTTLMTGPLLRVLHRSGDEVAGDPDLSRAAAGPREPGPRST